MIKRLLKWLCPSTYKLASAELALATQLKTIQRLEDIISNKKSQLSTTIDKLSITSHAIHRYRERHGGKGSDQDIERMLYKCLVQQLHCMDTLPDGTYDLRKNVKGVVSNNTLVTVLPHRQYGKPKLR